MGIHCIPCYRTSLQEFKRLEGHGVLKVYLSGAVISATKRNDYMIYHEPNTEDSNVNCFHFDRLLSTWLRENNAQKFTLASDSSSKLRSNLLAALMDLRVRVERRVSEGWWILYDSGHHEHAGDSAHGPIQKNITNRLRYASFPSSCRRCVYLVERTIL